MIYSNLLLFLVAIFIFSVSSVPEQPLFSPLIGLGFFLGSIIIFDRISSRLYLRPVARTTGGYFSTEKKLSVVALLIYSCVALYLCDAKYYLSVLSLGDRLPALVNIGGLALFIFYLTLMWRAARHRYENIFGRKYSSSAFVGLNIKANLPIVLPWVLLSLCYDLLLLLPFPSLHVLLSSAWGDLIFFAVFLGFLMLFFPPLVKRLWGCRPLPESGLKDQLITFCDKQNFSANLYIWPLFEGRVLTAGVMGILPGLRYILLTPAIIETMSLEELESVLAHEIGHVKKYHLLLYVFLICGFSLFAGMLAEPFVLLVLSQGFFVNLITTKGVDPETVLTVLGAVPLLIFLILYFRFIFGYFIRNFERQADLYVLKAVGNGRALVSAFEKIGRMGGNIRDQKNWHHFGIGERIDCIDAADMDPTRIKAHDRKVRYSLLAYLLILIAAFVLVREIPTEQLSSTYEEKYAEAVLIKKAGQEPDQAIWQRLLGDLMLGKKDEQRALTAYEKAFSLEPVNPEIMNNLAWLLLTSEDLSLRDPDKAFTLARAAATLHPKGHILDTLATAYWANGLVEEAVNTAKQAAMADPERRRLYMSRASGFIDETYDESVARMQLAATKGES